MLVDTHAHLDDQERESYETMILSAKEKQVERIILSFCEVDSIRSLKELPNYKEIYYTLGFHPSEATKVTKELYQKLEAFLQFPKVVGIGEIGLDFHYGKENREEQIALFEAQLRLAEKYDLPVVIHSRDATKDTIDQLKKHHVRGVIHCFSGSLEVAKIYIQMGFLLGIGGVVTFKNSHLPQVVSEISLDHIVLETDSPYLSPAPYRGKPNFPANVFYVAKFLSDFLSIDFQEVASVTTKNANALFDLH